MKFRASVAGYVTGIRFYKGTGNTGTHTGSLWNARNDPLGHGDLQRGDRNRLAAGQLRCARAR